MSTDTTDPDEDVREFVRENRELIADVLRYSRNSYARACAFVLLKHGGTERDVDAIEADLETLREEVDR